MPNLFAPTADASTAVVEDAEVVEMNWDAEVEVADATADFNEIVPIPPGPCTHCKTSGIYICKVSLLPPKEDGENPAGRMTKEKKPFISAAIQLEIVDEGGAFHGFQVNDYNVSSLMFKGQKTSKLHQVMNCVGSPLLAHARISEWRDKVIEVLGNGNSALIQVELDWRAARKSGPGKYDYEDIVRKMSLFPKNPEGDGHLQVYTYVPDPKKPRESSEHRASIYVSKYLLQQ